MSDNALAPLRHSSMLGMSPDPSPPQKGMACVIMYNVCAWVCMCLVFTNNYKIIFVKCKIFYLHLATIIRISQSQKGSITRHFEKFRIMTKNFLTYLIRLKCMWNTYMKLYLMITISYLFILFVRCKK